MNVDVIERTAKVICAVRFSHSWAGMTHAVVAEIGAARRIVRTETLHGIALAPLPTAIGDSEPDLIRVMGPVPEMSRSWRILATRQIRRAPKINALFDFINSEKPALKSILTG